MQCYRCRRLGHTAKGCNARKQKCLYCSDDHKKEECTATIRKCANCAGPHAANSSECKFIQEAREIEKAKVDHGLDYLNARKLVLNNKQMNLSNEHFPLMPHKNNLVADSNRHNNYVINTRNAYRDAVRREPTNNKCNSMQQDTQQNIKYMADASTQNCPDVINPPKQLPEELLNEINVFVIDILHNILGKEKPKDNEESESNALLNNLALRLQLKNKFRQEEKEKINEGPEKRNSNKRKIIAT